MRYLITGACGFIGTNLCASLLENGHSVLGIDALTENYSRSRKEANLKSLQSFDSFDFKEVDLMSKNILPILDGIDGIFHLAGHPSVHNSWGTDFQLYAERNLVLTQHLLRAAVDAAIPKFINSSSSSIYGRVSSTPTVEINEKRPISPYGVTKLAAENLVSLFASEFGLNTVSLRYFTVYGPRQRPDMAFHKIINAGISGDAFPLHGDGSQIRDFTYVDDVVNANILAATTSVPPGTNMNIGGGSPISLGAAIRIIEETMGVRINIEESPLGPGNPLVTSANCELASQLISWTPKVNIYEGLRKQIEWQTN
jgi:UDP-glucuronate 4-epimerase